MNWKHGLFAARVPRQFHKLSKALLTLGHHKDFRLYSGASLCGLFGLRGTMQFLGGKDGK
jgi:hypothetical protein